MISKTSFMFTLPSWIVPLSCIVGAVSSLLLLSLLTPPIPSLPISAARLPLLEIAIPEVLVDMLLRTKFSWWSCDELDWLPLSRPSNATLPKVVIDEVLENIPDVVDLGGVAMPLLARNVMPRSLSSSNASDARGDVVRDVVDDGGRESP